MKRGIPQPPRGITAGGLGMKGGTSAAPVVLSSAQRVVSCPHCQTDLIVCLVVDSSQNPPGLPTVPATAPKAGRDTRIPETPTDDIDAPDDDDDAPKGKGKGPKGKSKGSKSQPSLPKAPMPRMAKPVGLLPHPRPGRGPPPPPPPAAGGAASPSRSRSPPVRRARPSIITDKAWEKMFQAIASWCLQEDLVEMIFLLHPPPSTHHLPSNRL